MNRRSLFGLFFGGLLSKFLPLFKEKSAPIHVPSSRVDCLDMRYWGRIIEASNVKFEGCVVRPIDPSQPYSFTMDYLFRS